MWFASAVLVASLAVADDAPLFYFAESKGPHAVGLRVVEHYDYSRAFRSDLDPLGQPDEGERARPMQTLVWYPAEASQQAAMTVGDYSALWASEVRFEHPRMPEAAREMLSGMAPVLKRSLWAVRDAKEASRGRFPIIVYAPSFAVIPTPWENADLCEYLASNGYVVLAAPNLGVSSFNMTEDLAGIEAQARDISFLIQYAHTLPNADRSRVAIVGYSWGGMAALFAAARDNRVTGLISLDGSMRYYPGLVKQAGDIHPEIMSIPLLSFQQSNLSFEDEEKYTTELERGGPNVLNAWTHGDLITIRLLGLTHLEFGSMYQRDEGMWKRYFDPDAPEHQEGDYSRADGIVGYAWAARYTLAFLDAYIKHDAAAGAFLRNSPVRNGVPKHVLWVRYRAGAGTPPSLNGFRLRVGREGFDHVGEIYASIKENTRGFQLNEDDLSDWAEELLADGHPSEAISLLNFNIALHPASATAYAELGDAYKQSGNIGLAIDSYKQSVALDPLYRAAQSRLDKLARRAGAPN